MTTRSETSACPSPRTLARYGISDIEWHAILHRQDGKCAVCLRSGRKWNIDHEHVPGWIKLPPEERKKFVRGILCWHCNRHVVHSNLSAADAERVAEYLRQYERRRDGQTSQ